METLSHRIRERVETFVGRVRVALDLPSRTELSDLTTRLEELDRRIAALAAERVAAMATAMPALPEPEPEPEAAAEPEPEPAVEEVAASEEPAAPAAKSGGKKSGGARQRKK